jgi:hypothetical protein
MPTTLSMSEVMISTETLISLGSGPSWRGRPAAPTIDPEELAPSGAAPVFFSDAFVAEFMSDELASDATARVGAPVASGTRVDSARTAMATATTTTVRLASFTRDTT